MIKQTSDLNVRNQTSGLNGLRSMTVRKSDGKKKENGRKSD